VCPKLKMETLGKGIEEILYYLYGLLSFLVFFCCFLLFL
jgi:hypothetical protein